ncbi:MAG: sulfite exporter TauE/SafE family protein [Gammaproteobacteria bacterium]
MMAEFSYLAAFLVGLLGGVHCLGMCGGIVGALSFSARAPQKNPWGILLAYNTGRITSYTLAGVLAGLLGATLLSVIPLADMQQLLLVLAGIFMALMGLYLAGWWPVLRHVERLGGHLWQRIEPLGRKLLPVQTPVQALLLGMLWGWLPCGLVYSVLIWSMSSGTALSGALLMLSFGLGTLPNLLLMGVVASRLQGIVQRLWVKRLAGSLLLVFALLMWWRAWLFSQAL